MIYHNLYLISKALLRRAPSRRTTSTNPYQILTAGLLPVCPHPSLHLMSPPPHCHETSPPSFSSSIVEPCNHLSGHLNLPTTPVVLFPHLPRHRRSLHRLSKATDHLPQGRTGTPTSDPPPPSLFSLIRHWGSIRHVPTIPHVLILTFGELLSLSIHHRHLSVVRFTFYFLLLLYIHSPPPLSSPTTTSPVLTSGELFSLLIHHRCVTPIQFTFYFLFFAFFIFMALLLCCRAPQPPFQRAPFAVNPSSTPLSRRIHFLPFTSYSPPSFSYPRRIITGFPSANNPDAATLQTITCAAHLKNMERRCIRVKSRKDGIKFKNECEYGMTLAILKEMQ